MKSAIAAIGAAVALTACGGGGGATPTLTEGLYMGSSFNFWDLTGQPTSVLVLEQQEVWVLEGLNPPMFFGQGTFTYTGKGTVPNGSPADVFSQNKSLAAISSTVLGEIPIELRLSETSSSGTFLSVYSPTTPNSPHARPMTPATGGFDYNKPASIQDIAGTWGATVPPGSYADLPGNRTLIVNSSGAISAPAQSSGCSLAGTVTPRPTGKNVFNLRLTRTGCADAGEYSGVAFTYMDAADYAGAGPYVVPTFRLIATNSDRTRVFSMTTSR